jgi:hypothetical protein
MRVDRILQLRLNNLEKQILVGISGPRGFQSYGKSVNWLC